MSASLIAEVCGLRRLVLSQCADLDNPADYGSRLEDYKCWHALGATLDRVEFWNTRALNQDLRTLLDVAQGFTSLKHLAFHRIVVHTRWNAFAGPPAAGPAITWLNYAVEIRRALPTVNIVFSDIRIDSAQTCLPESALRWLMNEAIPIGCSIGIDRAQRLTDDFQSFLPLWDAEDSHRGLQAAEERKDGQLVDAAMCSRWQQFSNVRRDQGEWTTI